MFPLYKYDRKSIVGLNSEQRQGVKALVRKLENGDYKLVENPCQCGNPYNAELTVEKDMFGIPNENILCANCGLIRSKRILDEASLTRYYDLDYKPINYNKDVSSSEDYYHSQLSRGKQFFTLIQHYGLLDQVEKVYDMGCGAGGVMHYFHAEGKRCFGNDFSEDYLAYGNAKGMQLSYGEMQKHFPEKNTVDLFILAHVYEHLNQPLQVLNDVFSRIRVGGYLLIEVPGVFANISAKKGYPAAYHQFAHVINFFHESYLRALFTHEHLDIVHGDERCTFLVKKTGAISQLFYPDKTDKYKDVKAHLLKNTKRYQSITNPIFVKRKIRNLLG